MKQLDWLKTDYIAHRGFYKKDLSIPENSISAFKEALNHGYSIELDVNLLKDGQVVVYHDHDLKRIFNKDLSLDHLTYEDIKKYKYDNNETIPLLKDVLDLVDGKTNLLIELKPHGDVVNLCKNFMEIMKDYQGNYAVFSFHPKVVYYLKKHYPHVIRGQISEYFKDNYQMPKFMKFLMKRLWFNRFTKPDFISYGIYDMPNKYLDKLKKKGTTIISYAAKSQKEFDFVKTHYDNVVFEYFHPKK
jgi:glycerophosphoryl diester phosphodiesterase